MKEKKQTLTEKLADKNAVIAKQEQTIANLQAGDRFQRGEFTKVLNSPSRSGGTYWGREEQRTLSWEEIFFQVGSISARLSDYDLRDSLMRLEQRVGKLENPTLSATISGCSL